ncbi:MAG: hypothetical protein AB8B99_22500 [Phormidesmis sp.]
MLSISDSHAKFPKIAAALTGGSGLFLQSLWLPTEACAQTVRVGNGISNQTGTDQVSVNRDANTGAVTVERNAYTLETGPLINTSNIPLPAFVPSSTAVGQPLPTVTDGALAPNSVIFGTDLDYIRANFSDAVRANGNNSASHSNTLYVIENGSISVTTEITLEQAVGDHQYGEGVEIRVLDTNNNILPNAVIIDGNGQPVNRIFVRGDGVTIGPQGQTLNTSEMLMVTYDENQKVAVSLLNLRENNAAASESGAYFTQNGELIVEDLQNGGDRDFNDGDYFNFRVGKGSAIATEEDTQITVTTETEETTLTPEIRREEIVVETPIETVEVSEDVRTESRTYGSVELPNYQGTRLGHATGVRTTNNEQTVYSRYAGANQLRAGSDGISATGQLAPLAKNPTTPPTLLTGELLFNPFVGNNEAGLLATAGVTQFLNRTHRSATDRWGNLITLSDGPRLLEATGWLNNRQLVGYVPERMVPLEVSALQGDRLIEQQGDRLLSINGIFNLSPDQAVVIAPPAPQKVGRGSSAYTDNVGGLLIERTDGSLWFQPQWTADGYRQTPTRLSAGEAVRIIYALVPQQPGQALQLDQSYRVNPSANPYRIADGGFWIISADQQPQNFFQESADVYAVEDTVAIGNTATETFNGQQGEYVEPSGDRAITVDLTVPSEVDARVGNQIYPAPSLGQAPYPKTTRAGGLYISGSLTGGIGNQRDRITRQATTVTTATDQIRTQRITNLFATPVIQQTQTIREETSTTLTTGNATFEINSEGRLENAVFSPLSTTVGDSTFRIIGTETTLQRGEEVLTDTLTTDESQQILATRTAEVAADETHSTDSYANATPLQGELSVGSIFNFGNTPWTAAANTLRAEVFLREHVLGRGSGSESGWRAALTFHPFGEQQRDAYHYNAAGDAMPLYRTEPVMDENGQPQMEKMATADGKAIEVAINRFVLDDAGDRIPATVGTGRSRGPGVYMRVQDTWNSHSSLTIDGGIQFSF